MSMVSGIGIIEPSTTLIIEPSKAGVVATLNRRVAAITAAHRMSGQGFDASHPTIANVLAGIRRAYGTRQDAKTALLTTVHPLNANSGPKGQRNSRSSRSA